MLHTGSKCRLEPWFFTLWFLVNSVQVTYPLDVKMFSLTRIKKKKSKVLWKKKTKLNFVPFPVWSHFYLHHTDRTVTPP